MSTLNIVNKSPFEKHTLQQCLLRVGSNDTVLLIEDATVAALAGTALADTMNAALAENAVRVLEPDLVARGLADKPRLDGIAAVDYEGFVKLVTEHDRVHSWL